MKKALFIFITVAAVNLFSQTSSPIILSEVMFIPLSGNNEFVEVYNLSESDSIDLNNYKIKYYSSQPNTIISAGFGTILPPKSYAVIFEGDYDLSNGIYHLLVPHNALILKLQENSFGSNGMSNTTDRPVWLLDAAGDTIDSYIYSADNDKGISDEKIVMSADSSKSNWKNSLHINGTPGFINSVTQRESDLAVKDIIFSPASPDGGQDESVQIKIQNCGVRNEVFSLQLFEDTDLDSIPNTLLASKESLEIAAGDSMIIDMNYSIKNIQSKKAYYANLICSSDQDTSNNHFYKIISPGFQKGAVLLNEIMYDPQNGEPEWIEIYNSQEDSINLNQWTISDVLTTPAAVSINQNVVVPPKSYFVFAKDSSISSYHQNLTSKYFVIELPVLNNDKDGVVLKDNNGSAIDSVFYNSSWGGTNGFSLERVSFTNNSNDSTNWITCISENKSTPGEENSVLNIPSYERADISINEIMYDPDIDNCEFIELYNNSSKYINLAGWKVEDEKQNINKVSETGLIIPPASYFVLSADSSILKKYSLENFQYKNILNKASLGLTSSGKLILLKDMHGNSIDSVWYSPAWHNKNFVSTKNISLERINPKLNGNDPYNWSSSTDKSGATPSKQNSIFSINSNFSSKISVSPNPFSPDNDGFEDFTIINYSLSQKISQVRIKIFDSHGRLVRTLLNNQPSGSSGSVIFNGLDDSGNPLRIGIYIIYLEALNSNFGTIENLKTAVVVARKFN